MILSKYHDHDMISIRMLKICGESISKPLEIMFKSCIEKGLLPNECMKIKRVISKFQETTNYVEKYLNV